MDWTCDGSEAETVPSGWGVAGFSRSVTSELATVAADSLSADVCAAGSTGMGSGSGSGGDCIAGEIGIGGAGLATATGGSCTPHSLQNISPGR